MPEDSHSARQQDTVYQQPADEERVCSVAEALREGDEVFVGSRSRPLTVTRRDEDLGITPIGQMSDYPYKIVWMEGNGTEYRIRYSHRCDHYPMLYTISQLREASSNFQHPDFDNTLVDQSPSLIPKRYESCERVLRLVPVGIETHAELTDWVLSRNIEVIGDVE